MNGLGKGRPVRPSAAGPEPVQRCRGLWAKCPHAYQTTQAEGVMRGAPIMRCRLTGRHPDDCGERG